jgi:hypothetical protein
MRGGDKSIGTTEPPQCGVSVESKPPEPAFWRPFGVQITYR